MYVQTGTLYMYAYLSIYMYINIYIYVYIMYIYIYIYRVTPRKLEHGFRRIGARIPYTLP